MKKNSIYILILLYSTIYFNAITAEIEVNFNEYSILPEETQQLLLGIQKNLLLEYVKTKTKSNKDEQQLRNFSSKMIAIINLKINFNEKSNQYSTNYAITLREGKNTALINGVNVNLDSFLKNVSSPKYTEF